jgi:hypothetical protein
MSFTSATLSYVVNATGATTATQIAAIMQALPLVSSSLAELLGVTLTSQVGSAVGNVATLMLGFDISSPTFARRFPSVQNGSGSGPFANLFTGAIRAAVQQPVLAQNPVFTT